MQFLLGLIFASAAHGTLVTVQSQTQEQMDALTAAVNLASAGDYSGNARVTLGTIEATMSRVVDMESEFLATVPQSVPTLRLLSAIEFDSSTQTWHLAYEVMGRDTGGDINQFMRTLYFTKMGNAHTGDHENACLSAQVSDALCLQQLAEKYVVPTASLSDSADHLIFPAMSDAALNIRSTLTAGSHSLIERLDIFLPHATVKSHLARRETRASVTFGEQTQYTFGVGVLFLLPGKNTILFDSFELLENAHLQALISKSVSYSVAKHVSFFTEVVHGDARVRLVSVEYLVEAGHVLHEISASVNGHAVSSADCDSARSRILELADPVCLAGRRICEIEVYSPPGSVSGEVWATYTVPVPDVVGDADDTLLVNTLLDTRDVGTGTQLFSSINFQTPNSPRPVCTEVAVTAFNPTVFAKAILYESLALRPQILTSSTHTMSNVTVDGVAALTMADALLTLVLSPGDSDAALAYFVQNAGERVRLDEVYMSHAKPSVQFGSVRNTLLPVVTAGTGRLGVALDAGLLERCPLETGADFTYGPLSFDCVTTQDYSLTGAVKRPVSGVNTHFVYEVRGDAEDILWLRSNIFGTSDAGLEAAQNFLQRVRALVPVQSAAYTRTYWIWPLYAWPSEAPVGLKDKTLLSLAWSLGASETAGRRLLGVQYREPSRVHLLDLYNRHIDVEKLRRESAGQHWAHLAVARRNKTQRLPLHAIVANRQAKKPNTANMRRLVVPAQVGA